MIFFSFWHFYCILFFCTGHEEECTIYYATFSWVPPLGVPLQNDNMKAHIYFYQFIQFWNYTIITYCSSALDTRRSVSTKMLHFLEHRPLVSLAEKQHANFWLLYLVYTFPLFMHMLCLFFCTGHEEECRL